MSSKAAINSSLANEIADITECSICVGVFQEPRCLPCAHTFCLGCLEVYGKGLKPSGKALCPMCRKKFAIPAGGWKDLPRNYIVEKLLRTGPGKAAVENSSREETTLSADCLSKSVALQMDKCQELAYQLKGRAEYLSHKSQDVKRDILRHRDELKGIIDGSAEELLGRLDNICESTVGKLAASQRAAESRCAELKVVRTRLEETSSAGDSKDQLEAVAMEMKLLMSESNYDILNADISFTETQLPAFQVANTVGSVELRCSSAQVMSKCLCFCQLYILIILQFFKPPLATARAA